MRSLEGREAGILAGIIQGAFRLALDRRLNPAKVQTHAPRALLASVEELLLLTRGIYDGHSEKAWTRTTGFLREEGGLYRRFDETAFNTVFDLAWVKETLLATGWRDVYFASSQDLMTSRPSRKSKGVSLSSHESRQTLPYPPRVPRHLSPVPAVHGRKSS